MNWFLDGKQKGKTQQQIGESIGWSIDQVKKYCTLHNKVPTILETAKQSQEGRGTEEVPNGTFNFTEGWFRNSGIYELQPLNPLIQSNSSLEGIQRYSEAHRSTQSVLN